MILVIKWFAVCLPVLPLISNDSWELLVNYLPKKRKEVERILVLLPREEFPVMPCGILGDDASEVDMRALFILR